MTGFVSLVSDEVGQLQLAAGCDDFEDVDCECDCYDCNYNEAEDY